MLLSVCNLSTVKKSLENFFAAVGRHEAGAWLHEIENRAAEVIPGLPAVAMARWLRAVRVALPLHAVGTVGA
eukprot:COSAG02_NODE_1931_length_10329_cov_7.963930_2_plen_72_part_00